MTSPLVATKLYVPPLRRSLVARPRLSERLDRGAQTKLTLVSAGAGFGKTTVLTAWLAGAPTGTRSVAWLSLDESDSRPATFWTYVLSALQTVAPDVGSAALPLLQSAQPQLEAALTTVVNDLASLPTDVYLVLDDYHLVDGRDVQAGMTFLLDHLPPQVHLAISTRADPGLPLARLRARGELVELRAADLRFTADEVAAYLEDVIGLELGTEHVVALAGRTEGWIAALQLAALSMQGRADVGGFIAAFAGNDRYIVDYLVEEVLQRQPDEIRTFLLRTCVLERLSGSLCDAVAERHGGKAMLESLDRANLFLVPLDDSREWYRYHHLFADVLRAHLLDERPGDVPGLHRRASDWFDRNGEAPSAIRHALAAGDVERAADLVEMAIPALQRTRQEGTIREWVDALPAELVRVRPVLAMDLVGALMAGNQFDGVEERLQEVERCLAQPDEPVVADQDRLARVPGAIEMYRAALALVRGDVPGTLRHAGLAIDRAVADDHVTNAAASALSGLALWGTGDLEAAHRAYSACVGGLRRAGHIADVLGCSITLADIRVTQGRLDDALRTYEQALQLASEEGGTALRGTADMYVGMSGIACERNDMTLAEQLLEQSRALGEDRGLPQNPYRTRVAAAHIRAAQGDPDGALELLDEAQRVYVGDFSPDVRPIAASRARVLLARGRVGEAVRWAEEHALAADDELSYVREFEHVTLARVLLARYGAERDRTHLAGAAELLARLLSAAEAADRTGTVIEILVLQALVHQADGDTAAASPVLERALALAEPEGYVRMFVGEGVLMAALLTTVAKRRTQSHYVRRLLAACTGSTQQSGVPGLVDPLSDRELDVLRLLGGDLAGPDIARRLSVSVNTMRTHTKSIYAKLGVNSRRAAVRRARELELLSRARPPRDG